jgi:membrane peptidoglycan carboxypeptidase
MGGAAEAADLELYLNTISDGNGAIVFRRWLRGLAITSLPLGAWPWIIAACETHSPLLVADAPHLRVAQANVCYLNGQVLDSLVAVGDLSRASAIAIYSSDLVDRMIAARRKLPAAHPALTAHFVDYIVKYIKKKYGDLALYEGGLTITTTLDAGTQAMANKWVRTGVKKYAGRGVNTGAMLVMNPGDGEILAMVGSADYNNPGIRGQINLTGTDPLGWRGVGSSFKVYTYAAALQAGLVTPATLLNDEDGVIGGHRFSDWDGKHEGYISLRTALAESRNLPALWTYRSVGGSDVVSLARTLGVSAKISNPSGVSTTLGQDAMSMAEHLSAYSAFDNGGYRISPHGILRVTDSSGQVLESFDPNFGHVQVISPDLGYVDATSCAGR